MSTTVSAMYRVVWWSSLAGLVMTAELMARDTGPIDSLIRSGPPVIESGAVIRMDSTQRDIYLVFTGHEFADGGTTIRATLARHGIKASFFFTGDFCRNPEFAELIRNLRADAHYLGGHSDRHLLYAPWSNRDSLLVTEEEFAADLEENYRAMASFGITRSDARWFLPPFEWYNRTVATWCIERGLKLVNFTPGTRSNADYTVPEEAGYVGSAEIERSILAYEESRPGGLGGFILLTHIGTDPRRTDKFYDRLDRLISELERRGYRFRRLP